MTITIIKRGIDPKEVEHQTECRNCHTVFKFHPHDATAHSDQRDGNYMTLPCPVCSMICYKWGVK